MTARPFYPALVICTILLSAHAGVDLPSPLALQAGDLKLDGGLVPVAQLVNDQDDADVAYSTASSQYLVVFEDPGNNGDILGQFVDAKSGELIGGWFYIAVSAGQEYYPAVVYDDYQDRFLVVWQRNYCLSNWCYFIIEGRLVYGSYQGTNNWAGNVFEIANGHQPTNAGIDMVYPSAAYNADEHQYVVVYQKGYFSTGNFQSIYGQMIRSDASSPEVLTGVSAGFEVASNGSDIQVKYPDVAWSREGGSFLVVWQQFWPNKTDKIIGRYLYDTFQGTGKTQVHGTGGYVIAPVFAMGNVPNVDEYNDPAVTFDANNNNFVIAFTHTEITGLIYSNRIYAARLKDAFENSAQNVGNPFPVEATLNVNYTGHYAPDVVYSGLDGETFIVYVSNYFDQGNDFAQVNARVLRGADVSERFMVHTAPLGLAIKEPGAAGTNNGTALVVWDEEYFTDPYDWDIHGQRIKSYSKVYLPSVMKE